MDWNVPPQELRNVAEDQTQLNEVVCNHEKSKDSKIPSDYNFVKTSGDIDQVVGIATTGTVFFHSVNPLNMDPVFPTEYMGNSFIPDQSDTNLVVASSSGMLHYYTVSPA